MKKHIGRYMGKKASIGTGFTWVPALFIISFILIIFVAIVGAKGFFEKNDSEIKIVLGSDGQIILVKSFISFLNEKVEDKKVKTLIKEWADNPKDSDKKETLENEFKNFLNGYDFDCSIVNINSGDENIKVMNLTNYNGPKYSPPHEKSFLNQGIILYLISEKDNLIKINVYAGECKNGYS